MIDICLVGASGKMGKAVISAATNDDRVNINNFIVSEESHSLNKNVGEFHFSNISEYKFESYPNKDFDLIIDFATRDGIEKRIEIYKAFKKPLIFCSSGLNESELMQIRGIITLFSGFYC